MIEYQSTLFSVEYREKEKLILPRWSGEPLDPELFIHEMKSYMEVVEKVNAKSVIWDHSHFNFHIPDKLYTWIESEVNKPAKKLGMSRIGFILGEDVMAQFSTMDSFESTNSVITPKYFSDPAKAVEWITKKEVCPGNPFEQDINFLVEKDKDKGIAKIQLEVNLEQLPYYLKGLKQLMDQHTFIHQNYLKYMLLTSREKEILALIVNGSSNNEIAETLFISLNTVTTHRKNILKKLDCKRMSDLIKYAVLIHL